MQQFPVYKALYTHAHACQSVRSMICTMLYAGSIHMT